MLSSGRARGSGSRRRRLCRRAETCVCWESRRCSCPVLVLFNSTDASVVHDLGCGCLDRQLLRVGKVGCLDLSRCACFMGDVFARRYTGRINLVLRSLFRRSSRPVHADPIANAREAWCCETLNPVKILCPPFRVDTPILGVESAALDLLLNVLVIAECVRGKNCPIRHECLRSNTFMSSLRRFRAVAHTLQLFREL